MATYSSERRSVLKIIGAIGATCAYPFAGDELFAKAADENQPKAATTQRFLNERDFETVSRLAELIIPETETAGAAKAGVPSYIDGMISRVADHQMVVADGLRWLDAQAGENRRFVELPEERQIAILEPLCEAADQNQKHAARTVQFFALIKNLTADGYYTSQVGLVQELGYKNDIKMEYPACPETGNARMRASESDKT